MNIYCPITFTRLSRGAFDELSVEVMRHVFASHKKLGRLCDERIYKNDISSRLKASGLSTVISELPVQVRLRDFTKTYYLDLVVQNAFVTELKVLESLVRSCEGQLLNYLFLVNVPHGKLINMRTPSVIYRTVNAMITRKDRMHYSISTDRWHPQGPRCKLIIDILKEALISWGAYLDFHLYEEAVIHFLGGQASVLGRIPLKSEGQLLGSQPAKFVNADIGFTFTGFPLESIPGYESHLRRLVSLTSFRAFHWINMYQRKIDFTTLSNW
jgi:GxxExxY protein